MLQVYPVYLLWNRCKTLTGSLDPMRTNGTNRPCTSASKFLGIGGIFGNRWIVTKWGEDFMEKYQPSIEYLELYALVAGVLTWVST